MEDRVFLINNVDPSEIHTVYNWGDVFITMPNSDTRFLEQVGLTVPQALASGLPVITYDYGGQCEFVDETCGYTVPYKNYELAGNNLRILLTNDDKRKAMSNNARLKAIAEYSSIKFCLSTKHFYEERIV
jgi:glycosyltransferase involved in cell wall biosynthesis